MAARLSIVALLLFALAAAGCSRSGTATTGEDDGGGPPGGGTGQGGQGGGECTSHGDCPRVLAWCGADAAGVPTCVECLGDEHCADGATCDTALGRCAGGADADECGVHSDCPLSRPWCGAGEPTRCQECLSDAHCANGGSCDALTGGCSGGVPPADECQLHSDCPAAFPWCAPGEPRRCVGCLSDAQCPAGESCEAGASRCSGGAAGDECAIHSDCPVSFPWCRTDGQLTLCVDCLGDRHCGAGQDCDPATNLCFPCDTDGDGHEALACDGGDDCDDAAPGTYPGASEACAGQADEDCDGQVDEGCDCEPGEERACYPPGLADPTRAVGPCADGLESCGGDGLYGPCLGAVIPEPESAFCDSIDQDCDGSLDEDLINACGFCGPAPEEICANGLNEDCDGAIDNPARCNVSCLGVDPESPPPGLACCVADPDGPGGAAPAPAPHAFTCVEWPGLDGCTTRACLDLDGDPATGCAGACYDDDGDGVAERCVCGAAGGPDPVADPGCGFETPCNRLDCGDRQDQPCYSGPPRSLGVGACRGGLADCSLDPATGVRAWGSCDGEVLPGVELCGNDVDDDCDGGIDESDAAGAPCPPVNGCDPGAFERCDGADNDCDGVADEGCCVPSPEICDGADNDCDGLRDDGVISACGRCWGLPCFTEQFGDPADCAAGRSRDCNGIEPDPVDPTGMTLGQATALTPFIFISVTDRNEVAKLDTATGLKVWQVASRGTWPSRTAVALDYSVWVGNRGFGCENDPSCSNLVHLDPDGAVLCKAEITGIVRAVAIDAQGFVWAGSYNNQRLFKIHGTNVLPLQPDGSAWPDGLPRCELVDLNPADPGDLGLPIGVPPYGAAIDGRGFLWVSATPTVKVDTVTGTVVATVPHQGNYGIAIDQNNDVWFGNIGGNVHRILGDGPYDDPAVYQLLTNATGGSGIAVASDGMVWCSGYSDNTLLKVDPANPNGSTRYPIPPGYGANPHGVAEDGSGKIWMPMISGGYAFRFDPVTSTYDNGPDGVPGFAVDPGRGLYTYSDMTGAQLRTVTTREGHWIQNFDAGRSGVDWISLRWGETLPAGTSVEALVRAADSLAGLTGSPDACGPYSTPPIDLQGCPALDGHRYLAVELVLRSTQDGARPTVAGVELDWAAP